ncbi:Monooxygenase FAD-binding protein [Macrophomina phaseolina MS6]|uniref:Monooxygenase FAD-binding protein n=1 Tax=Macrophomina phaseolina (strain MS6) TaxID=1126212 RepID=K2S978_MACPH|nr:Monooxygenase FAD-binding protein [Macrophomina phaseolina MS6]
MEGDKTAFKWVRMDGKFATNMPNPNVGTASIETDTHGNVLWVALDHDAHRIGYVLSPKLYEKYGDNITEEQAKHEAVQAMKPFSLEIERLDWMTCYGIGQRVAERFHFNDYVLLARDAGQTHSSGVAQGMNTGVHDATNLSWKLAGTVKGWYKPSVLQTYEDERRPSAQKLIEIDKSLAANSTPDEVLAMIMEETVPFTVGLGINYTKTALNNRCSKPGAQIGRIRLYEANKAAGRWTILVFAGNTALTAPSFARLREALALETSFAKRYAHIVDLITIVPGIAYSAWTALEGPAIGKMLLDPDFQAHERYGVLHESGAIVVLRPDTVLGFAADFDCVEEVDKYFTEICT